MPPPLFAAILLLSLGGLVSSCGAPKNQADDSANDAPVADVFQDAGSAAAEWLTYGGTYDNQRYSTLKEITPGNVRRLGVAWTADLGSDRGVETTPIVHDGILYATAPWSVVHALDAKTGKELWAYDPATPRAAGANACCDVGNRGLAYKDNVLYLATLDGRLEAINATSGAKIWSVRTFDAQKPYTITGAPIVVKDMVLIGNGGEQRGVRGYLTAYDSKTGKLVWRFYTVPNPNKLPDGAASDAAMTKLANKSWGNNGLWKTDGGGGTVWDSIVYDRQNDQILFGVGGGAPWNAGLRDPDGNGDDLFLSSIVAVDADSGAYRWHFQETPRDDWNYGATQSIVLADIPWGDGKTPRRVVLHASANGFFYVLDAKTGAFLDGKAFIPQNWASGLDEDGRPVEVPGARAAGNAEAAISPGFLGAHNWSPVAFDPERHLAFIPALDFGQIFRPLDQADAKTRWKTGYAMEAGVPLAPPGKADLERLRGRAAGKLIAFDPLKGEARWSITQPIGGNGGLLATASGLVFQGRADGLFTAYESARGRLLWKMALPAGIIAPPVSYEADGAQYVAVATGLGGAYALWNGFAFEKPARGNAGRIVAFRLGAKEKPTAPVATEASAVPAAPPFGTADMQNKGRSLYARNCASCHGAMAISSGVLPDLRWSAVSADRDLWRKIVLDGARATAGMGGFADTIDRNDAEAVRAYVLLQANGPVPAMGAPAASAPAPRK